MIDLSFLYLTKTKKFLYTEKVKKNYNNFRYRCIDYIFLLVLIDLINDYKKSLFT